MVLFGELEWATIDLVRTDDGNGTVVDNRVPVGQDFVRFIQLTFNGGPLDCSIYTGGYICQVRRFADSPLVLCTPLVTQFGAAANGELKFQVLAASSAQVRYLIGVMDIIGIDGTGQKQRLVMGDAHFAAGVTR